MFLTNLKTRVAFFSNNCLFSLPTRDGYVYVNNGTEDGNFGDHTLNRINHLLKTFGTSLLYQVVLVLANLTIYI